MTGEPCCRKETARDAAAVLFGLKFADNIRYTFKSSQAWKSGFRAPNIPAQNKIQRNTTARLSCSCTDVPFRKYQLAQVIEFKGRLTVYLTFTLHFVSELYEAWCS